MEDGFSLTECLRGASSLDDLPLLLGVFDKVMMQRARAVGDYSIFMGRLLSTPDGPLQKARDRGMRLFDPNGVDARPNIKAKYGTPEWQAYLDDYDPAQALEGQRRANVASTENLSPKL